MAMFRDEEGVDRTDAATFNESKRADDDGYDSSNNSNLHMPKTTMSPRHHGSSSSSSQLGAEVNSADMYASDLTHGSDVVLAGNKCIFT